MALSMVGQEAGQFNDDLRSVAPAPEGPGMFSGLLSAIPAGVTRGVYVGSTLFDREQDRENEAQFSERVRQARQTSRDVRETLKYSTKMDPATYGTASQIVFQFAELGAAALAGSAAGGPVGGSVAAGAVAGRERFLELQEQGVDESAATLSGIASGVLAGVGFRLAPFYGMKTITQVASGVGINVAAGAADRYSTHKILQGAGYDQVAEHYQALDGQAMVVDALLGAAFPAIHKLGARLREPTVDQTDAAMVATEQYQKDTSLPAYPRDNEELGVMQQKLDAAYEQLIVENRPVSQLDIGELPSGAVNESMIQRISEAETVFRSAVKDDPELAGLHDLASDALKYADDFLPPKRVDVEPAPVPPQGEQAAAAGQDYDMFLRSQTENIARTMPDMVMTIDGERVSVKELTTKLDEITTKAEQDAKLVNIAKACALTFGE